MKSENSPIQRLWARLMRAVERCPAPEAEKLRIRYFIVFVLLGVATMTLYGGYNLVAGHYLLSGLIAICAVGLVAGCLVLLRVKEGKNVYRLNGIFYCVLLVYLLAVGGDDGSKALWSFTFPLIALFLLGKREGVVWVGGLLLAAMIAFWAPLPGVKIYPYSDQFIVRFISTYLIISAISYWFEYFRFSYRQKLEEERQRFIDILVHSREILYRRDLESGKYVYISKAFGDILGYSHEELAASDYTGIEGLIHPDDLALHNELLQRILMNSPSSNDGDHIVEYRMRCKDGAYLWFSDQIAVVRNASGQPEAVIGSNREITRQRRMEKALKETRDQLRTILDSLDAHIYVADMQTYEILFMNSKMRQDFGRNMEGEICWKSFRNADGPCAHCTNTLLLDENNRPTGVHEWECFNPLTRRWYNNYDRAIQWIDGNWVRIQIAVDITRMKEMDEERQRNQEALRRARHFEAIGALAGGMAHDFNNLLQIILGNCALLELDIPKDSKSHGNVNEIKQASDKAKELANRLITFSTGGAPNKVARSIAPLLESLAEELEARAGIDCTLRIADDLWPAPVDPDQMTIVLQSVVNNACESMNEQGKVLIAARNVTHLPTLDQSQMPLPDGRYVQVSILDEGGGIPEAVLPKIFEPYFSTKAKGKEKGVGLSLSISYSIVQQHGGHIAVDSRPGGGTVVDVYLPVATDPSNHRPGWIS